MLKVLVKYIEEMMQKLTHAPRNMFQVVKKGTMRGSTQKTKRFQSKVGKGLRPRPCSLPVMMLRLTLSGSIQVIQLKIPRAMNNEFGSQNQQNIAAKAMLKNLMRDQRQTLPHGPTASVLLLLWKAVLRAMVTSDEGQTQNEG